MNKWHLLYLLFIGLPQLLISQVIPLPLSQRIESAEIIVEGKVINQEPFWDLDQKYIYTRNEVEVFKIFKGELESDHIEIITHGGTVGDIMLKVDHCLQLAPGEIGVFTLYQKEVNAKIPEPHYSSFFSYGDIQGFIKYDLHQATAEDHFTKYRGVAALHQTIQTATGLPIEELKDLPKPVINAQRGPLMANITGFSPSSITAGTGSVLTINGSGFGGSQGAQFILFANADNGGANFVAASTYNSWSDNQIQVVVPTSAGTGIIGFFDGTNITAVSGSSLSIPYARINTPSGDQARHVSANGINGYDLSFHIDYFNTSGAVESFMRALRTWKCDSGIAFIPFNVTTTDANARDGENIIRFDNGGELPAGVLGRLNSWYRNFGGDWYMDEFDLVMDDGRTWNYSTSTPGGAEHDFESVTLHELGHAHELAHVIDPTDVMNFNISSGVTRRTPTSNNSAATAYVIGQATTQGSATPPPMVTESCPPATDAAFFSDQTVVYTDQTVAFTDVSIGTISSRSWDLDDGKSSALNQVSTSYSLPGTKTITLTINGALTETKTIQVLPFFNPTYTTSQGGDFESNTEDWGSAGVGTRYNIWELGSPANALNVTPSGSAVWKTDLDSDITALTAQCALYTPAFNLSASGTYIISMKIAMERSFSNGPIGVIMEYTTDNGTTWTQLGASGDLININWYDISNSSATPSGDSWSFDSFGGVFIDAIYDLFALVGNSKVGFRISYFVASGFPANSYDIDGFAIDDFSITSTVSLPVELTKFKAQKQQEEVLLSWETATETNNEEFRVLRSKDGVLFMELGRVKGAGNSLTPNQYTFKDPNPLSGKNYYRLKQIDFDGSFEFSDIQTVEFETKDLEVELFPNPVYNEPIQVQLPFDRSNMEALTLLDARGKQFRASIQEDQQENNFKINVAHLPAGIYFIQMNMEDGQVVNKRFIKK